MCSIMSLTGSYGEKKTVCSAEQCSLRGLCLPWTPMNNIVWGKRKLKMQGCNLQESGTDLNIFFPFLAAPLPGFQICYS